MITFNVDDYHVVFSVEGEQGTLTFGPVFLDGVGEANSGSNVGVGEQVYKEKLGNDLVFRTLQAGGNVTIETVGDEIFISDTGQAITQMPNPPSASDDDFAIGDVWFDTVGKTFYLICDTTPGAAVWQSVSGQIWNEQIFLASQSQITFLLNGVFTDMASFFLFVNGVKADPTYYTISGNTITWLNTQYIIDAGDCLIAKYR